MSEGSKKILLPQKRGSVGEVIVSPSVKTLLDDALGIISTEIIQFRNKVNKGKSLDLSEARVLQGYIKALVELSKEAREREDDIDFANMSDEELLNMVEALKKKRDNDK